MAAEFTGDGMQFKQFYAQTAGNNGEQTEKKLPNCSFGYLNLPEIGFPCPAGNDAFLFLLHHWTVSALRPLIVVRLLLLLLPVAQVVMQWGGVWAWRFLIQCNANDR